MHRKAGQHRWAYEGAAKEGEEDEGRRGRERVPLAGEISEKM